MHHGVTFNFGSAKVCSPAIFETSFSYKNDIWIAATNHYVLLHNCAISIDSYSPINKFYSFIIFILLINAVILLILEDIVQDTTVQIKGSWRFLNSVHLYINPTTLWPQICF